MGHRKEVRLCAGTVTFDLDGGVGKVVLATAAICVGCGNRLGKIYAEAAEVP